MVRLSGRLICKTQEEAALVRRHLDEHVRLSRAESGCVAFDVAQTDDPMQWKVSEAFVDEAAFEMHRARTCSSDWWAATAGIERAFRRL